MKTNYKFILIENIYSYKILVFRISNEEIYALSKGYYKTEMAKIDKTAALEYIKNNKFILEKSELLDMYKYLQNKYESSINDILDSYIYDNNFIDKYRLDYKQPQFNFNISKDVPKNKLLSIGNNNIGTCISINTDINIADNTSIVNTNTFEEEVVEAVSECVGVESLSLVDISDIINKMWETFDSEMSTIVMEIKNGDTNGK